MPLSYLPVMPSLQLLVVLEEPSASWKASKIPQMQIFLALLGLASTLVP